MPAATDLILEDDDDEGGNEGEGGGGGGGGVGGGKAKNPEDRWGDLGLGALQPE